VRQGVRDLKSVLDELGLRSFLKTSGNKGYHIYVPCRPSEDFAKSVAMVMEKRWPKRYTSNSRKVNRRGKIFVDWMRNGRGATSIAPYSVRAKAGARVSMPISWEELDTISPDDITMNNALERVKLFDNPWVGLVPLMSG